MGTEKCYTFANGRKDLETGLSITFVKRVTNKTVMNIVLVIRSVIPVVTYGGTERVIWYLGKELVRKGHCVTFLADKGLACDFAKIIHIDPKRSLTEQIPEEADIVHFNNEVPKGGGASLISLHIMAISFRERLTKMRCSFPVIMLHAMEAIRMCITGWIGTITEVSIAKKYVKGITF